MSVAPVEFPTVEELEIRRQSLLHDAGMTFEELLNGEYTRSLARTQYVILDRIRGIDFLLEA